MWPASQSWLFEAKTASCAFFNVCRHKAAPILNESCGTATKLRCRYHGWTYDLAGKLRGTPEFEGVADFRKEDNGLVSIAVATWGPFVWVHLDPPTNSLEKFLDPLPTWAADRMVGLHFADRVEYELACNWKVYVDNYLDGGYHVNTVHPGSRECSITPAIRRRFMQIAACRRAR